MQVTDTNEYEYTFALNEEVEIIGHEIGRLETFFTARIIREQINGCYQVEYNTINSLITTGKHTQTIPKAYIRPKPHQTFIHRHTTGAKVDVYTNGGWYTGRILGYKYHRNSYDIHFNYYDIPKNHNATLVRIHKKWTAHNNSWKHYIIKVPHFPFYTNDEVEIIGHEDGLLGSFHRAKIISQEIDNQYRVEYKTWAAAETLGKHTEKVHFRYVRPIPDPTYVYIFPFGAKVDVFDNGGWWTGIITGYDKQTRNYEVELNHYQTLESKHISDIRIHQSWNILDNKWKYSIGKI